VASYTALGVVITTFSGTAVCCCYCAALAQPVTYFNRTASCTCTILLTLDALLLIVQLPVLLCYYCYQCYSTACSVLCNCPILPHSYSPSERADLHMVIVEKYECKCIVSAAECWLSTCTRSDSVRPLL
jgi:hypothetical protein